MERAWKDMFGRWNRGNLESEGVYDFNASYKLVRPDHPVIHLLRHNESLIGFSLGEPSGCMYKIPEDALTACCRVLREKVMQ